MRRLIGGLCLAATCTFAALGLAQPAGAKAVPRWYCSTTTTVGQACIPDPTTTVKPTTTTHYATTTAATTTTATTIATTTTKPQETTTTTIPITTTIPPFCIPAMGVQCVNVDPTTTTVPASTTTAVVTTVPASTVPPPDTTVAIPPPTDDFVPTTVAPELPHTGVASGPLAAAGLIAVAFGLLFVSLAWKDSKRISFGRRRG